MADISIFEITVCPPADALGVDNWSVTTWRISCSPDEALRIATAVHKIGWLVSRIDRADAMSLEDAAKKLAQLELVAQIVGPSPWKEDGSLTEAAKEGIRSGKFTMTGKDGKKINPDA